MNRLIENIVRTCIIMPPRGAGAKRTRSSSSNTPVISQGKGPVKRTQLHPYDAAGNENTMYEVEHILSEGTIEHTLMAAMNS